MTTWEQFEQDFDRQCGTVEAQLKKSDILIEGIGKKVREYKTIINSKGNDLALISQGQSDLQTSQDLMLKAHFKLTVLGHDLEMCSSKSLFDAYINLNTVFKPITIPINQYNSISIRQTKKAEWVHHTNDPCMALGKGALGLKIPLEIDKLGEITSGTLFIPLLLVRKVDQKTWENYFQFILARGPSFCSEDPTPKDIVAKIRQTSTQSFSRVLRPFPVNTAFIDDLLGPSYLYSASITENLAFFGAARDRLHGIYETTGKLPEWANGSMNLHAILLKTIIGSKIPDGSTITQFISNPTQQFFKFSVEQSLEKSKGGDLFKVTVGIRITVNFLLTIRTQNPDQLIIDIDQLGYTTKVYKVKKEVFNTKVSIPGVDQVIESLIETIVSLLSLSFKDMSREETRYVSNTQQLDTQVVDNGIIVFIKSW